MTEIISESMITHLKGRAVNALSPVMVVTHIPKIIQKQCCLYQFWNGLISPVSIEAAMSNLEEAKALEVKISMIVESRSNIK